MKSNQSCQRQPDQEGEASGESKQDTSNLEAISVSSTRHRYENPRLGQSAVRGCTNMRSACALQAYCGIVGLRHTPFVLFRDRLCPTSFSYRRVYDYHTRHLLPNCSNLRLGGAIPVCFMKAIPGRKGFDVLACEYEGWNVKCFGQ